MTSAQRLFREHDELLELVERIEAIVARSVPTPTEARDCLRQLAHLLEEHLVHESSAIYPMLATSDTPYATQVGRRFSNELTGLSEHWRDYLARWSRRQILLRWAEFREETYVAMRRLVHRIERENEFLLPAALKFSAIGFRDGSAR